MVAWSLPPEARRLFKETIGYDDATWAGACGWVAEQTLLYIPYDERTLPVAVEQAERRLQAALEEDA